MSEQELVTARMALDDQDFPVVRLHYEREAPESEAERLVARQQRFVLIGTGGMLLAHGHAANAAWRRFLGSLGSQVLAMIEVEPNPANRFIVQSGAEVFASVAGYPLLVVADLEQAEMVARRLLARAVA